MKQKLSRQLAYWLGVAAIGLIVGLGIQFVQAWTEPQSAPPGGNVGAPINVDKWGQTKVGSLVVNSGGGYTTGLTVNQNLNVINGGKVGIGTQSPTQALDVVGTVKADSLATTGNAGVVGNLIVNGNVGIGTPSPSQKLDVAGYVKGQSGLCIGDDCKSSWSALIKRRISPASWTCNGVEQYVEGTASCPEGYTLINCALKGGEGFLLSDQFAIDNFSAKDGEYIWVGSTKDSKRCALLVKCLGGATANNAFIGYCAKVSED